MKDRQALDFKALCTESNIIRKNYYSTTHRVSCTVDGKLGDWDLVHIEIPFPPQMEAEYMRRFAVSRDELPVFYHDFSTALSNHLKITKALCGERGTASLANSVVSYKLVKVYSGTVGSADADHKDVYLMTEPMTGLMDSTFFGLSGTTLRSINTLALSLLDFVEECNEVGISLGALDLESLFITDEAGQEQLKSGFFFYGSESGDNKTTALTPDAKSMMAPELESGAEGQSIDTDVIMLCRLLWKLYDGQRFDSECELEFAPQYASDALTAALVEGLESGNAAVNLLRKEILDLTQSIDDGLTEDTYIVFVPPLYLSKSLPTLHTKEKKEKEKAKEAKPDPMGMADALQMCFGQYSVFSGRSSRREYALFHFSRFIALLILMTAVTIFTVSRAGQLLESGIVISPQILWKESLIPLCAAAAAFMGTVIPSLALGWRRIHDVGQNGWLCLIPGFGNILCLLTGEREANRFGAVPNDYPAGDEKKRKALNALVPGLAIVILALELGVLLPGVVRFKEKSEDLSKTSSTQGLYVWNQSVVNSHGQPAEGYSLDQGGNIIASNSGAIRFLTRQVDPYVQMSNVRFEITQRDYSLPDEGESVFRVKEEVIDLSEEGFRFDPGSEDGNEIPSDLVIKYQIDESSLLIVKSKTDGKSCCARVKLRENQNTDELKEFITYIPENGLEERDLMLVQGTWTYEIILKCEPQGATNTDLIVTSLDPEHLYFAIEKETTVYAKAVKLSVAESGSALKVIGKQEGEYGIVIQSEDGSFEKNIPLRFIPNEQLLASRQMTSTTPEPSPAAVPSASPEPTPSPSPTPQSSYSQGSGTHTVYVYVTPSPTPVLSTPTPTSVPTPEPTQKPLVFSCDVLDLSMTVGESKRIFPTESCSISFSKYGIVSVNPDNFEVAAIGAGECDIILTCTLAELKGEKISIHVVVTG